MATVSHARYHPPAPPTAIAPPTAAWEASDRKSKSSAPAFMRPLVAAYRDHHAGNPHHRQHFRWQQQQQKAIGPPPPKRCEHHQHQHHQYHSSSSQSSQYYPYSHVHDHISTEISSSSSIAAPSTPSPHRFLVLNELPRMPSSSSTTTTSSSSTSHSTPSDPRPSPFLRLPIEIRLQIYALLVLPRNRSDLEPNFQRVASSTQDYFDYDKKQFGTDRPLIADTKPPTLLIRTIDPELYHERYPASRTHARSIYSVRASRFRSRCMQTTYQCVNNPRIEHNLSILRVNQQIHAEAAELLYSSYTFDFDTHVEAIVPFFADLTPFARSCIQSVRVVKRALAYDKEYDRFEWSNAMRYLTSAATSNLSLRRFELGVVAGRPGPAGWDRIAAYSAADFDLVRTLDGMEWLQYLLDFRGLRELDIHAVVEHCPPVTSSTAMASYVRFSASVETGFSQYLRQRLLAPAVC